MPKRITDPVYGTIEVDPHAVDVIDTAAFQRLRRVKHLGLAHLVYPGANYTRLSHSLGTYEAVSQLTATLPLSNRQRQHCRIAALLHDIGHYPLSHAVERAAKEYYNTQRVDFLSHEELGQHIIENDQQLSYVWETSGPTDNRLDAGCIASYLTKGSESPLSNLISSDVDADRIDYLQRTALHTGLPYGRIDLDYLRRHMAWCSESKAAFTSRAIRALEHVLLGRYFDYQQINWHKTVAALEELLKAIVVKLLKSGRLRLAKNDVCNQVDDGSWRLIDDVYLEGLIRTAAITRRRRGPDTLNAMANALLDRRVPSLIFESADFGPNSSDQDRIREVAFRVTREWDSSELNVHPDFIFVWKGDVELLGEKSRSGELLICDESGNMRAISEFDDSIMGTLSQNEPKLRMTRVYALVLNDDSEIRDKLSRRFTEEVKDATA